jgi:translocation and assembly module TamB
MRLQLDLRLTPLSLELAEHFVTGTDLRGDLRGTGEVRGTLRDLHTTLALQLPAGRVDLDGRFDVVSDVRTYQATARFHEVDLAVMAPSLPQTALNGTATISGRGTTTRSLDGRVSVRLRDFVYDSTRVAEATAVASVRDAQLTFDTLLVRTAFGTVTADGTFGLVEGREGTLRYGIEISTVAGLQRWIASRDSAVVYPRPLVRQRALAGGARRDSTHGAGDTTSIAALMASRHQRRGPLRLPEVQAAPSLARDSIAGALGVRGTLRGGIPRFTARGNATINHLVFDGTEIGRGTVDFTFADLRSPDVHFAAEAGVDSLTVRGFAFDSTHIVGTYRGGNGDVAVEMFPGDTSEYRFRARYAFHADEREVHLQDINLRFDSLTWRSTRESTVRWRGGGLAIDSLELRSGNAPGRGRILVHGEVPDRESGRLSVRIDSVRVSPWLALLQTDMPLDGIATVHADIDGTRTVPRWRGSLALQQPVYGGVPFPEVHSQFTYADQRLRFDGDLRREAAGAQLAQLRADLPIDLSLGDSIENRKLNGPISVELEGDSIPLAPLAELVEEISHLEGEARGRIAMRGTWDRLHYEGAITATVPRLGLRTPGITLTNTVARLQMIDDRLVIDSLVGYSGGPFRARGALLLANPGHPVLDVDVFADETRVLDNQRGQLVVSAELAFRGPMDTLAVGGTVAVMHGVIRIPDPQQWNLINTGDPVLFAVVDTALARELEIRPPSRILRNANVNVRLRVMRGTWARSREANVEVFGDLAIERQTGDEELQVTGALHSDYGDYEIYGRRFRVTRGSARFTGSPSNPVLQLLATHEVRQAGRAPFDIEVSIGGSLDRPNVSLASNAQPTLNQSDLISFLAFGQSSTSLLRFDGSGIEGGGLAGSSLAGNVASLATRQLASVALGALFTELESDLSERTAADVLNIKPADLPAELSLGALGTLARGTQVEIGKYIDRNTFFVGQIRPTFAVPGATLERRFGTQWRLRTSFETRYQPRPPSLASGLQPKVHQVLGALIRWTRSW